MEKIIFTDLDGTIKEKNKPLTDFCNKVFFNLTKRGVLIVPTTGRDRTRAEDFTKGYGGSNYIITSNGANVFDTKLRKDIYTKPMNKTSVEKIVEYTLQQGCKASINVNADFKFSTDIEHLKENEKPLNSFEDLKDFLVFQVVVQGISNLKFDDFKATITSVDDVKIGNVCGEDDNHSLDVVDKNVEKGQAVKFLLNYLKIDKSQSMVFGNDFNDISMFKEVGKSFCVENSIEKLKPLATQTIGSVFEDGVPKFLVDYFNLNKN